MPKLPLKKDSEYQKRKKRKPFRKRAAIEPIIRHLKQDYRAADGQTEDAINFMMAATEFNLGELIKKLKASIALVFLKLKVEIYYKAKFYSIINVL